MHYFRIFDKKERELTQKLEFVPIALEACRIIESKGRIFDVDLMIALKFSPPSWKVWKPKLVEKLNNYTIPKTDREKDDETKVKFTYNKKQKLWEAIEFLEQNN